MGGKIRLPSATNKTKKELIKRVWRIAIYIRLSKGDGNDESESVVNQKKILRTWIMNNFKEDEYVIIDEFIDDGLTGTSVDTRRDFLRMEGMIEDCLIDCVVVKTLSRAFRNHAQQGYYLEEYFKEKDIRFISVSSPYVDTFLNPNQVDGLEIPITGILNDRLAARTSEDVKRVQAQKREDGDFIGAFAPYGYLKNPKNKNHLIIDPDIYPIKHQMKDWIIGGMSLNAVAGLLNDLGIPNPTKYKHEVQRLKYYNPHAANNDGYWCGTTVKRILLDWTNLGHIIQGKQRVISYKIHDKVSVPPEDWVIRYNKHEATFTEDEYQAIAEAMERETRAAPGEKKLHLFSGFLFCKDCRKALHRKSSGNHVYYYDRTPNEKKKCTARSIREDRLTIAVLEATKAQISLISNLSDIVDAINSTITVDTRSRRLEKMLSDKKKELARAIKVLDGLYSDWKIGEIDEANYRRMKATKEDEIIQIKLNLSNLEDEQADVSMSMTTENPLFKAFQDEGNVQQLDRMLLNTLIEKIELHTTKEITITFKFQDQLTKVIEFIETNLKKQESA